MKHIALYGRSIGSAYQKHVERLVDSIAERNITLHVYKESLSHFAPYFERKLRVETFSDHRDLAERADFLVSIGGDGTFLDATQLVRDSGIPIIGINTGRLGFLSRIAIEKVEESLDDLLEGEFEIEERVLLKVESENAIFGNKNFALNELTLHKKDSTSMVKIHCSINGEFLNTYWADGLIISTPTGSTAYSLSCGGPIVAPNSDNFVITPIAPHNLNVRPIILSDDAEITLEMEGRSDEFLASLDSRTVVIRPGLKLRVKRNDFTIKLLRLKDNSFLDTIRNKLNWGLDQRN